MTDGDYRTWLASSSRILCVLVEAVAAVAGVETTRYVSSTGYTSGPTDTPANQHYLGVLSGGGASTEQLSSSGGSGMAFGDLEYDNPNHELDGWLDDVWANRDVRVYVGDQRWPRADFRLVFDGKSAELTSRNRNVLNQRVRDKLQRLNTSVSELKLGGSTQNADRLQPIVLGEVHNIEPLLVDQATLTYQVNVGPTERIIEVRDAGVPVAITESLDTGRFDLDQRAFNQVTCSVQGAKLSGVYVNTVAKLVELLATAYGTDPLAPGDLDAANLAAFDAAHPQPVGLCLAVVTQVLTACQQLAAAVGAQVVMTPTGLLRLVKIALPATGTPTAVDGSMMVAKSLELVELPEVRAAVKLGYCRNWTVQTTLAAGIPAADKDLFAQEWLTTTATDPAVAAAYQLTQEPEQEDTLLQVKADAAAEAARRRDLWMTQRRVFRYQGAADLLLEELGGYQTITHDQFGLAGGVSGQIISIQRDWLKARATIEVLV